MPSSPNETLSLRELIAQLTSRVYRLEQALHNAGIELPKEPAAAAPPVAVAPPPPVMPPVAPREPSPVAGYEAPRVDQPRALESVIGSQWLNRIGIAAVLVGVSFFLKWAFDNNWIGPSGRIAIGLLAGVGVTLWSERFRRKGYVVFSWSIKAVGIGVLYLSLWAGFQLYHLFPAGVAFGAMIIVTAATAFMALSQDAQVLAAFALVGGFVTPVLVSTGENHEFALFSYVALLDIAAVALIAVRPWRRLLPMAFVGTLVLYIGWYADYYSKAQANPTLAFASLFFAIFAGGSLIANARETHLDTATSRALVLLLPIVNAAAYFLEVYVILDEVNHAAIAWFALALAAVFLGLSRVAAAGHSETERRDLRLLHIALAIGFITVAVPLKLEAHWITIGWFVEAGALFWVGRRSDSQFLRALATISLALGIVRLLLFDNFVTTRVVLNSRFSAYVVAIAVLAMLARFGWSEKLESDDTIRGIAIVAINVLALVALTYEISDGFLRALRDVPSGNHDYHTLIVARDFSYSALWMVYGALLMFVGFWKRSAFFRWQALILIGLTIGKVFIYDMSELERVYRILSFIVLGVLLLAISFAYQKGALKLPSQTSGGDAA
jgi:uncharacterized membrane protein